MGAFLRLAIVLSPKRAALSLSSLMVTMRAFLGASALNLPAFSTMSGILPEVPR